ncbi:1-phosphofructokinase [Candidatus Erwinia haradaeae]|uniref:Phosphofructokinase n=1 Tax=Candidatus Erwinia haradaeae TaxID=1922217 RepID=A0A803FTQ3_9GAMM|nr:1-phosphofructokinase [Candidatus Erwinia haradaeae]VFP88179.1 1-phosphofructokinase [Candidatus Erwinia haradaeae]
MNKNIATITFNPAYDLVGYTNQIHCGEVNLLKTTGLYPAGKGINVAKILKYFSIDVTVSGFLGKENQDGFQKLFTKMNFSNRFILVEGRTRINVKVTEKNGSLTDLNFSGFSLTEQAWEDFASDSLIWLKKFDILCISGSLPTGIRLSSFSQWMRELNRCCPFIIFDSSQEALLAGLEAKPWLIKPNHRELETLVGKKLSTIKDIVSCARNIQKQGIHHVVVSLGPEGAVWVNPKEEWIAKPPYCNVVSTVGAGDAMVGGMIYGLLMNYSSEYTLRLATALSSLTVSQSSLEISDRKKLDAMMERIVLHPYQTMIAGETK